VETVKNKDRKQRGASAIITALCLFVLLGVAAFAVDTAIYFLRFNELQNAADAGALAGARVLYDPVTKLVNTGANQVGHYIAE
jgi:Flp pilus assembly protein TadG